MAGGVKPRRRYDTSGRRETARRNRRNVLAAARRQFLETGYAGTTLAAIAAEAGVSVETIYKGFRNKPGLLKAVFDVAVVGDDEPVPLQQRDSVRRNMAEPDPRRKLAAYADHLAELQPRAAPVQLLARSAAATDDEIEAVWHQMREERLMGMTAFARHLDEHGHLRTGVSVEEARDILWTYNSPDLYELVVLQRGWSPARYARWIEASLVAALLPAP